MADQVLVIDGHPDKDRARLCHALCAAYVEGAREAGKQTRLITVAELDFPLLRSGAEFAAAPEAPAILAAREDIAWADHLAFVFPLWIGSAPALMRAFIEQVSRAGFFADIGPRGFVPRLKGKSGRMIVTMGMPALFQRAVFGARGLSTVADNLRLTGVSPMRLTLFGAIESEGSPERALAKTKMLGQGA